MEERLNKNELVFTLFRAALGLVYMQMVYVMRIGAPETRMQSSLTVMFSLMAIVVISLFIPESFKFGRILLFIFDVTVVLIGFFMVDGVNGPFVYFLPLLGISAGVRFSRMLSMGLVGAVIVVVFLSTIGNFYDLAYQAGLWSALTGFAWLVYEFMAAGWEEKKYRLMYADMERQNESLQEKIRNLEQRMQSQTIVDPVTGLKNFRYFRIRIEEEISRAARLNYPFSLCLLEVEGAEKFIEAYGEDEWKTMMHQLAARLRSLVRDTDLLGRYNENQFLALLPQANGRQSLIPAMRIKKVIEKMNVGPDGSHSPSMAFGISCYPEDVEEVGGLLSLASAAVKKSTKKGRGMITLASSLYRR